MEALLAAIFARDFAAALHVVGVAKTFSVDLRVHVVEFFRHRYRVLFLVLLSFAFVSSFAFAFSSSFATSLSPGRLESMRGIHVVLGVGGFELLDFILQMTPARDPKLVFRRF